MNTGERLTVITKIAATLSQRNWSEVDLTLEQFGFPTSDVWNGDLYSYVVEHIKSASELNLFELHDYLFPGDATSPPPEEAHEDDAGGIWDPGFRLFVSHSSIEAHEMGDLKAALREHDIAAFVAHNDIEPSQEWRNVIETALHTCEAFTSYVTPNFHPSNWCDQEVGAALARGILVIPINRGVMPYGFMGKYQALPGINKSADHLARKIAEVLAQHSLTSERYATAREARRAEHVVTRIETAGTFDGARKAFGELKQVPIQALTDEHLQRIESACKTNDQLTGAQWNFGPTSVAGEALNIVATARATPT